MPKEHIDFENLPSKYQLIINSSKDIISILISARGNKAEGKPIEALLDKINTIGGGTNKILEERSPDHSMVYFVLYETLLNVKEAMNYIPNKLLFYDVSEKIFSLSLFLINTLMYFASEDAEKLNLIVVILSELLVIDVKRDQSKRMPDVNNILESSEKFTNYWRFSAYLISMIHNAIETVPVLAKSDFLLWSQTAMKYAKYWADLLSRLPVEKIAQISSVSRDTITQRSEKITDPEKLYFEIKNQIIELHAYNNLSMNILNILYSNETMTLALEEYYGNRPVDNHLKMTKRFTKIVKRFMSGVRQFHEQGLIDEEYAPEKSQTFTMAKLVQDDLELRHIYEKNLLRVYKKKKGKSNKKKTIERILKWFIGHVQGNKSDNKKNSERLQQIIDQGKQTLSHFEEVFEGRENLINSPYFGTYRTVLEQVIVITWLLYIKTTDYCRLKEELKIVAEIKAKVPIKRTPTLYVIGFIAQANIAYHENNTEKIQSIIREIDDLVPSIQTSDLYATISLQLFSLLNKALLKTIDLEELNNQFNAIYETMIKPQLPHLAERFLEDKERIISIHKRDRGKLIEREEIEYSPFDFVAMIYPQYWLIKKDELPKYQFRPYLSLKDKIRLEE